LLPIRLRDVHPSNRKWSIGSISQFFRKFVQPSFAAVLLNVLEALLVDTGRAAIYFAAGVGEGQDILSVHFVVERIETKIGRSLRFVAQRRLQLLNTWWGY
jgi:hypothetical protein